MNIISKLTLRHLLENKKRSVVTMLGIATSTALISAIMIGIFSFFRFFGYLEIQNSGNAVAQFNEVSLDQYNALLQDKGIAEVGLHVLEEKQTGVRLLVDKADRLRIGNIDRGNPEYIAMKVVSDYDGKLPVNSSEIAVEESFLTDNGLEDLKIGDTLTFEQGYRYIDDELEGFTYLGGAYRSDEKFEALTTETCTVTAILHGNRATRGWDMLCGIDEGYYPEQKAAEVLIQLKKCDHTAFKQLKEIKSKYGITKSNYNSEYLLSVFAFEGSSGAFKSLFVTMAIALMIVIATSVVLIFNSIGMSLTERMRYLGMLASVGATARQKRFSIYYEGLILGLVGIPLGLLLGYIGTKITLAILGSKILEADMISGAEGMRGGIPIFCSPVILVAIVLFSAVTILISTFIPAIRAARIMPIDALRETSTIKVKARKLKGNALIRKLFGYEGELAYKNIKRNGVKGTVITISIAVSVILFLTINFFCNSIARANQYSIDLPYQVVASCSLEDSNRLRAAISGMDGVDAVYSAGMVQFLFTKGEDATYELANTDIADPDYLAPAFKKLIVDAMSVMIIDDVYFNKLLSDNNLDRDYFYGDTLRGVLLNNYYHDKKSEELFNTEILGQKLHYDQVTGYPPAIEMGALVPYDDKSFIFKLTPKGTATVFVPASMYYEKAKEVLPEDKLTMDLAVETRQHEEVYNKIYNLLETDGYHNYSCSDLTDVLKIMDTITIMLKTAMYGFTTLLTLIAVANIVNTISTGVLLRRKEFAMYKSVGMASGGFKKMIRLEALLYGIKALGFGLPTSLLISYCMFNAFDSNLYVFNPDWIMYVIVIVAVFAILGVSMALSINKIKDDNIIEALKEDAV
jgi:putative ABC transport system permease protein